MPQQTFPFSIKYAFPFGFVLADFATAIAAAGISVPLVSCSEGQVTTQNLDDPEAVLVFEDMLAPPDYALLYAAISTYAAPPP